MMMSPYLMSSLEEGDLAFQRDNLKYFVSHLAMMKVEANRMKREHDQVVRDKFNGACPVGMGCPFCAMDN